MFKSKNSQRLLREVLSLHSEYQCLIPSDFTEKEKESIINTVTYHSSKLEGLTLNYGDTMKFLRTGLIKSGSLPKDIADIDNHRDVLQTIFDNYQSLELTPKTIKKIHGDLMKDEVQWDNSDLCNNQAGKYKQDNNYGMRANGEFKEYLSWPQVPAAMKALCKTTNENIEQNALFAVINFHYQFANEIHPFWDGNGRMVRLLSNLLLLKNGYPILNIPAVEKVKYLTAIIDQEKRPERESFATYMLRAIKKQLKKQIQQRT